MSVFERGRRVAKLWAAGLAATSVVWLIAPAPLTALAAQVTGGSLRPYWHIFIAYAVAWILVVVWLVHIARRLRRATEDGA